MDSYKKDEIRRRHNYERKEREKTKRDAPRLEYNVRYATAAAEALTLMKANQDYQIIVDYLAECSAAELENIVLDTLVSDVLGRGCTLAPARIKGFLQRDLKLKMWTYQDQMLVRCPHGWTRERGSFPIDSDAIWESWNWYPPDDSEWA